MKICIAIPNAWIGGIRTFALNMARQFRADGHEVCGLIAARGQVSEDPGGLDSLRDVMDLRIVSQRRVLSRSRFIRKIARAVNQMSPDVILLNHTVWGQAALPYLNPRIKRVIVVHNETPDELRHPKAHGQWWDALVAVGPGVNDALLRDWPAERVRLIPVGVAEPNSPRRLEFDDRVLRICFIGRLSEEQKNVLLLPEIASIVREQHVPFAWTVVGDGPDRERLAERIEQLGLGASFRFEGACTAEMTQKLLALHQVLILPSRYESIGHVLQEAQMLGVIPVASRLEKSTAFVINDGENGLLSEAGNAAGFAEKLVALHRDRELMRRLSANAVKSVRERFAVATIAKRYYELFGQIDAMRHRPARAKATPLGLCEVPRQLLPPRWQTAFRMIRGAGVPR